MAKPVVHPSFLEPSYGWRDWHHGPSGSAVLMKIEAREDGTERRLYACAPCQDVRGLVPALRAAGQ
ncbi:hypothetical protein YUMDRAFT_03761 [Streptomyces sp. OspMP-M45]|nr:hypothetical protein YUMDRAFT_03761 [Streptomyces sp. OspMP-M45]